VSGTLAAFGLSVDGRVPAVNVKRRRNAQRECRGRSGYEPQARGRLIARAGLTQSLYLDVGGDFNAANDGSPLFVTGTSTAGQTVNLGSFAVGTELFFRLNVRNPFETPNVIWNYFTGPGSRNADGKARARVQSEWLPGTTLVSRKTSLISISGISAFRSPARPRSSHPPASPNPARSRCLASASQGRA